MNRLFDRKLNRTLCVFLGFLFILIIGFLDFLTGYEYSFSVFYVLPVSLISWYSNRNIGLIACFFCAIVWFIADTHSGHPYSNSFVPFWNTVMRFAFFSIIAILFSALKIALEREQESALTDHLTGAANSRRFYEVVQMEINRLSRSKNPFTIAYLDIDNFKTINDQLGHSEGDLVLKTIVNSLKSKIRGSDLLARLGGDEFALFFPDTGQEDAHIILTKVMQILTEEMENNAWPVTFSVGVVTCLTVPSSVNQLIKTADALMYSVKHQGKNMIRYSLFDQENTIKRDGANL